MTFLVSLLTVKRKIVDGTIKKQERVTTPPRGEVLVDVESQQAAKEVIQTEKIERS